MGKNRKYMGWFLCIVYMIIFAAVTQASEIKEHGKGLLLDDDEFLESLPEIVDVRMNRQAIEKLKASGNIQTRQRANEIQPVKMGEETITDREAVPYSGKTASQIEMEDALIEKITSYDGSASIHFPPIGDQGLSNSCVAWSMGYHQLTNNIANVRNLDAKHNMKYRISPAWVHNLTKRNDAINTGTREKEVSALLLNQGAPYWSDFLGETTTLNFISWNPNPLVWEKALENRVEEVESCSLYNEKEKRIDLIKVKKMLYNGYVVSFGSDFDKHLICMDRIKYPEEHKGEYILTVNKETPNTGGHEMTIVGWDDTLRIDIDGNGVADTEGAFKVANSWGVNGEYTNHGYFWLAYDAILPKSEVAVVNIDRKEAIQLYQVYFLKPRISYQPLLLLELTLLTESRRQLGIRLGASEANETKAESYKFVFDRAYDGTNENMAAFAFKNLWNTTVNYDFYGNETNQKEATFVFDLTDTVVDYYGTQGEFFNSKDTNFYIQVEDKIKDGYGSILKGVKIIDRINNRQADFSDLNVQVDGTKKEVKLKATVVPGIVDENKMFVLNFNYPIQKTSISNIKVKKNSQSVSGIAFENDTDRKKVTVFPPDKGYLRGQYYSMDLSGVKSDGGNLLHKNAIDFYVP